VKLSLPRDCCGDLRGNGETDLVITQADGPCFAEGTRRIRKQLVVAGLEGAERQQECDWDEGGSVRWAQCTKNGKWRGFGILGAERPFCCTLDWRIRKKRTWCGCCEPTGVPQDEVKLAAKKTQTIAELDRRGGSCPIPFSWNGNQI
jgi:hypothetical protein